MRDDLAPRVEAQEISGLISCWHMGLDLFDVGVGGFGAGDGKPVVIGPALAGTHRNQMPLDDMVISFPASSGNDQ